MKSTFSILLLLLTTLLVSCGKEETAQSTSQATQNSPVQQTAGSGIVQERESLAATEYVRVQKLHELTTENIATQVEKSGDTLRLKDRQLFVNYLLNAKITSTENLLDELAEISKFAKKEKVVLDDSDYLVMLAGFNGKSEFKPCNTFAQDVEKYKKEPTFPHLQAFCAHMGMGGSQN